MDPGKQDEIGKVQMSEGEALRAKLHNIDTVRKTLSGQTDGVAFVDKEGHRVELDAADFVLLTRERFTELASGRLLDVARGPDRRTMRALADELHGLRDVADEQARVLTVDLGGEALRDMAAKLAPDPLGPVKLGRKERRAEERRRRRGGR